MTKIYIKSNEIKLVKVSEIIENPKNANIHSIEQIKRLEEIIEFQGFRNPLVISNRTGFLIAGHGRLMAAKNLGMKELPVIYQDFESEAQEYAHLIADNEIARWAKLDKAAVIESIADLDIELQLLGIEEFDSFMPEDVELPDINSGNGDGIQNRTFKLTDEQVEQIDRAIKKCKDLYSAALDNPENDNSNGNALSYICELFITK